MMYPELHINGMTTESDVIEMIKDNIETNIETLSNKRIKNYQKAHLKINTDNLSIQDLCDKIIKDIS